MHDLGYFALVAVMVVLTIIITALAAIYRSRRRLRRSAENAVQLAERSRRRFIQGLDQMEFRRARLKPVQNKWWDPIIDTLVRVHLTPDRQTYLRAGLFALVLLWVVAHHFHLVTMLWAALLVYIPASLLDLTDGATARRYEKLRSANGKLLDPFVDTLFSGLFSLVFLPLYAHWIIPLAFFSMLAVRALAFHHYRQIWSKRLKLGVFEKTEGGELKAGFAAVAFAFIMLAQVSHWFSLGSEFLLVLATLFEFQSLVALRRDFQSRVEGYQHAKELAQYETRTDPLER